MRPLDLLRFALGGLVTNRLRSALTMLGILIGVAAVIALTAVGNGASLLIQQNFQGLGTNSITVFPATPSSGDPGRPLTLQDTAALSDRQGAPDVATVSPVVTAPVTAAAAGTTDTVQLAGSLPSYVAGTNAEVELGAVFTAADVAAARPTVLLGRSAADALFGAGSNPVGRQVSLADVPFTVVGVLAAQEGGFGDGDQLTAVAPLSTVQSTVTGYGQLSQIVVQARSAQAQPAAEAEVRAILDRRHGITDPADADYQMISSRQLLAALDEATAVLTLLLAAIAGISLVVGGIGITNIMLVSVTERTREIGIRKALGAQPAALLGQFLAEATILSLLGGGLGVATGYLVSTIPIGELRAVVLPSAVLLAFGVSAAIGLFFGSYPAVRAARMRPIDALRHQ